MIYLDYAATSWPKPPEVVQAMADFLERAGGNAGRSGHRLSIAAGRSIYGAREMVAQLFNAADPLRVIFTMNATHALNIALCGLLRPGDRVVTTGIEHNAVMRPLRALERRGVQLTVVPCGQDGRLALHDLERAITPGTRLVVVNHASNVTGALLPVAEVAAAAHRAGALLLVDAAQTAGALPIDVQALGIDLLAFTGHKGMLGPPGTGGLVIGEAVDTATMEPLMRGGTGSLSEHEEQPEHLPDKLECGTPNGVGIVGLAAGVRFVMQRGVQAIREHELELTRLLCEGLGAIAGVSVYGPQDARDRVAVVSFTAVPRSSPRTSVSPLRGERGDTDVSNGMLARRYVSEIGLRLDEECGILCRVGLHCAPAAHRTIGTFPEGTVRLAPGLFTTPQDIRATIAAVENVVGA